MNISGKFETPISAQTLAALCACCKTCADPHALRADASIGSGPEWDLAARLGTRYATYIGTRAAANLLAFMALTAPVLGERAIAPEDEVLVVAGHKPLALDLMTALGATPVFLDVPHPQSSIDEALLENALSMQTKAVLLAHTADMTFDLRTVRNFCNKYDLWLIEDSLDAGGATYDFDGTVYYTGTVGDVGTVALKDGAALLTNNDTLYAVVQVLRDSASGAL